MITDALRRRAIQLGVQLTYDDVDQVTHDADPEVVARIVEVLDGDAPRTPPAIPHVHLDPSRPITVDGRLGTITDAQLLVDGSPTDVVIVVPGRSGGPFSGEGSGEIRLPADLPLGCHTLTVDGSNGSAECLVVVAPEVMPGGGATTKTSSLFVPTYALWDDDRPLPSFELLRRLAHKAADRGIDTIATLPLYATFLDEPFDPSPYSPISRLHWNEVFLDDTDLPDEPLPSGGNDSRAENVDWRALGARRRRQLLRSAVDADDMLVETLARFAAAHPDIGSYARFRAARESSGDLVVERSHVLAQYLADQQLGALAADDSAAALSLDLPIGSHPDGWETWAHPTLFAEAMAVGAPPDTFFTEGQNWGFPPQLPSVMQSTGYELWRQMIARAGRHASMLRLDHVMAVHRLWWVPTGQSAERGVYVTYPHEELLAVIAASAAAADITIVGENLGTVPPEVDRALDDWQMVGMYEEQFHLDEHDADGRAVLRTIPTRSVAGVRTHDMAPFAEVEDDISDEYRAMVGVDADESVLDGVLTRLATSDADMVVADLDDLLDEHRPHNLPGRVVPGIWQRRLDRSLTDTMSDERVERRLRLLERTPR